MRNGPAGTVAGLVLAAGAGTRYGGPKAPVVVDGERLVDRAVRVLTEGGCDPVLVVLGAWIGDVPGAETIANDAWAEGMGSSLRAGLEAVVRRPDIDDVLITLVDLPGLSPEAVNRVIAAPGGIVAASYSGERGHPVRLPRQHWSAVIGMARGDEGARRFLRERSDVQLVEVDDVAVGYDLDTPEE